MSKRFKLGQVVATRGVADLVADDASFAGFVNDSLGRFIKGDWGDTCGEDAQMNDLAVKNGDDRILAAYIDNNGNKIWIITEWDHSVTTILFPDEY